MGGRLRGWERERERERERKERGLEVKNSTQTNEQGRSRRDEVTRWGAIFRESLMTQSTPHVSPPPPSNWTTFYISHSAFALLSTLYAHHSPQYSFHNSLSLSLSLSLSEPCKLLLASPPPPSPLLLNHLLLLNFTHRHPNFSSKHQTHHSPSNLLLH